MKLYNPKSSYGFYAIAFAIIIVLIVLNLVNYSVATKMPSGEQFFVYWSSTRLFLEDGISPYSREASRNVLSQAGEYGYRLDPSYQMFSYPLYFQALILPFSFLSDFTSAQVAWMTLLEIALILTGWYGLKAVGWNPGRAAIALILVFALFNYFSLTQIYSGSIVVLQTLFVVLALSSIRVKMDELAGIYLAIATVLPQTVLPLLLFVFIWAISNDRWRLVAWTLGITLLLAGIGLMFLPGWPVEYLRLLINMPEAQFFSSPGAAFRSYFPGLGSQLGWSLTVLTSLVLLVEWWAVRKKDFRWFRWTACLTLTLSPWLGLPTEPGNFVLLLVPLFLVFATIEEQWGAKARLFMLFILACIFTGFWIPFVWDLPTGLIPRLFPALFLSLPLMLVIGLYWVRWWAVRPRRTFIEELKAREEL